MTEKKSPTDLKKRISWKKIVLLGFVSVYILVHISILINRLWPSMYLVSSTQGDKRLTNTSWELHQYYRGYLKKPTTVRSSEKTHFFLDFDSDEMYSKSDCEDDLCDQITGKYLKGFYKQIVFRPVSGKDSVSAKASNECFYNKCDELWYTRIYYPIHYYSAPAFLKAHFYRVQDNKLYLYNHLGIVTLIYSKR